MKLLLKTLIICMLCNPAYAFNDDGEGKVTINGQIKNATLKSVSIEYFINTLVEKSIVEKAFVDPEGKFKIAYQTEISQMAVLTYGNDRILLFLEADDQLKLTFDEQSLESTLNFEGKGAVHNKYMQAFVKEVGFPKNISSIQIEAESTIGELTLKKWKYKSASEFLSFVNTKASAERRFISQNVAKFELSEGFSDFMTDYLDYKWAAYKLAFARIKNNPFSIPSNYFDFLRDLMINNENALDNITYLVFLDEYIQYQHLKQFRNESTGDVKDFTAFQQITNKHLEGKIKAFFNARLLLKYMDEESLSLMTPYYDRYIASNNIAEYNNFLKRRFEVINSLKQEKSIPSTELENRLGEMVNITNYNNQKLTYIIFWASWCDGCKASMEQAEDNIKALENKEIEFVFISLDDSKEDWLKYLDANGIDGNHYILNDNGKEVLKENLDLSNLPKYYLINEQDYLLDKIMPLTDRLFPSFITQLVK